jgi:hypothetical protein
VNELILLNNYTNNILLNLFWGWIIYAIYKKRSPKIDKRGIAIAAFYLLLLLHNWITFLTEIEDIWYYVATATVIIPFTVFSSARIHIQIAFFVVLATLLYIFDSEQLIQLFCFVTIVILLINARKYLLQSAGNRILGIMFSLMAVYYFFIIEPYTLSKLSGNWSQSKYLIYFAISDYIVFTTMLIVIHANFRRLFFN